jgi:putative tryptophan/tyrosine transport system substrate-binding protein
MKKIAFVGSLFFLILILLFYGNQRKGAHQSVLIGCLYYTPVDEQTLQGFREAMKELSLQGGYAIEYVVTGPVTDMEQLPKLAADLVARRPALIFVCSTPAALAVKQAVKSTNISVVFAPVNDPVDSGIVGALVSPGGNITGVKLASGDAHRLRMLKNIVPSVAEVYVPYNPEDKSAMTTMNTIREPASRLGLRLHEMRVSSTGQLLEGLRVLPTGVDAIFLPRDSMIESQIVAIQAVAIERRLPLSAPSSLQAEAGALFSYGHNHNELGRQAARMAVQILKGIPAGDLPVEESRIFFEINLKTAEQIGLSIPDNILRQADRIIR